MIIAKRMRKSSHVHIAPGGDLSDPRLRRALHAQHEEATLEKKRWISVSVRLLSFKKRPLKR